MSQDPFQEREAEKYANPIPSREFILEHLTKREKPASRDELAVELHIEGEEQLEGLRRRLRAMERDGQLVFTRRQCYALPERLDLVKGTVIGHRDGYGFLRVEGRKDDLYLSSEQMKTCIHGDQQRFRKIQKAHTGTAITPFSGYCSFHAANRAIIVCIFFFNTPVDERWDDDLIVI